VSSLQMAQSHSILFTMLFNIRPCGKTTKLDIFMAEVGWILLRPGAQEITQLNSGFRFALLSFLSSSIRCYFGFDSHTNFQVQMDISKVGWISGVIVQGRREPHEQWVTSFQVSTSADLKDWDWIESGRVFDGNSDQNTKVIARFHCPVEARYVRIHPKTWLELSDFNLLSVAKCLLTYTGRRHNHVSMRAALILSAPAPAGVAGAYTEFCY
jgi:hypothetical protein